MRIKQAVDLDAAKASDLHDMIDHITGPLRVDMHLDGLVLPEDAYIFTHAGHGLLESDLVFFAERFEGCDHQFNAVTAFTYPGGRILFGFFLFEDRIVHFSRKEIVSSLENLHQALSAGIDDARFLQDRQQFRCALKLRDSLRDRTLQESIHPDLRILFIKPERFVAETSRDSQDRSLLGFHNCLVCRFHCLLKSTAGDHRIDLVTVLDHF